jgi:hypothetical protein
MSTLNVPNSIVDGAAVTAVDHQQNYDEIEGFINGSVIHADGSKAMNVGAQLLLGVAGTASLAAVTKAQLDSTASTAAAATTAAIATASGDATTKANAAQTAATTAATLERSFVSDLVGTIRTTTQTGQTISTVTLNPTRTSGTAIVTSTVDVTCNTAGGGTFVAELHVAGVTQTPQMIWHSLGLLDRVTLSKTWILAFSGASTVYEIKVRQDVGGSGKFSTLDTHTTLQALFLG